MAGPFARELYRTVLAACHTYVPERELSQLEGPALRRRAAVAGSRAAARFGLIRRRFDLDESAERLANLSEALPDLERTYALFADDASRARLVELFALRALGADHVRGPVAFGDYARRRREMRARREATGTLAVADPSVPALDRFAVTGPAGSALRLHATDDGLASVFALGQYRYEGVAARAGDVVLDGGAGWGDTVLWFADLVGAGGRVLAFEFSPGNLRALGENLALNPALAGRVTIHERALWDRGGERLAFSDEGQVSMAGRDGAGEVTTVTVDEVVEQERLERLDFVKLDVEGAEPRVLAGASDTLRRLRPKLAVAVYHDPLHLIELPRAVDALGVGYRLHLGHSAAGSAESVLFAAVG